MPDFTFEDQLNGLIAGVDEVGRGPFAGPVVAAAVILDRSQVPVGITDSKLLSLKKREALYDMIFETAQVGIGEASVGEIDKLNILKATFLAMKRAVAALPKQPDHLLIDGNRDPKIHSSSQLIVKGDSKSLSISAASIVAKVTRDRQMKALSLHYPHYGWDRNAGYGTAEHRKGLLQFGVTPQHRRSFAPIRKLLDSNES